MSKTNWYLPDTAAGTHNNQRVGHFLHFTMVITVFNRFLNKNRAFPQIYNKVISNKQHLLNQKPQKIGGNHLE